MTEKLKQAFRTFPLAGRKLAEEGSNVTIPDLESVERAKEWVDEKEM